VQCRRGGSSVACGELPDTRLRVADQVLEYGVISTSGSLDAQVERQAVQHGHDGGIGQQSAGDLVRRLGRNKHGVRVLTCDAAVHTAQVVRDVRQVALVGGGGTDMAAGIDSALALTPQPDLIVVITDGWTPWPSEPPRVPVVAVLTQDDASVRPPDWLRTVDAAPRV